MRLSLPFVSHMKLMKTSEFAFGHEKIRLKKMKIMRKKRVTSPYDVVILEGRSRSISSMIIETNQPSDSKSR